jgi:xylose isomerase
MRTYLILKDRATRWNADPEIKTLLAEISALNEKAPSRNSYQKENATSLLQRTFDRPALASKGLQYERLDQLTIDVLLGVR